MKTNNVYGTVNTSLLDGTLSNGNIPSILKTFNLPLCLLALAIGLASASVKAETENPHPNYRYIEPVAKESKTGNVLPDTAQKPTLTDNKPQLEPIEKPTDGKGALPTFAQADIDGSHYITKVELKNYPYLLQVFDKVDAGEDGKLEQHEYQNLEMETKREGEIR